MDLVVYMGKYCPKVVGIHIYPVGDCLLSSESVQGLQVTDGSSLAAEAAGSKVD